MYTYYLYNCSNTSFQLKHFKFNKYNCTSHKAVYRYLGFREDHVHCPLRNRIRLSVRPQTFPVCPQKKNIHPIFLVKVVATYICIHANMLNTISTRFPHTET